MSPAIAGVGAYAPRARIPGDAIADAWGQFKAAGVETTAVPDPDEDAVTMAYEAATRALEAADVDAADLRLLSLGTSNPPSEEGGDLPHLAAMLGAPEDVATERHTGSTAAGMEALRSASEAVDATGPALVVASDAPRGAPDTALGQGAGAGAAAFVVADAGPAPIADTASFSRPSSGTRYRGRGETETEGLGITSHDRAVFRETVAGVLEGLDVDTDRVDAAAVQAIDGKRPYRVTDLLPVDSGRLQEHTTVHDLGDTAAASAPLSLAVALADGAEGVVAVGFGGGATAEAATVTVDGAVPADVDLDGETDIDYAEYIRQSGHLSGGQPAGGGAFVSVPAWDRSVEQRYRLEAGRCENCGALNLPVAGACNDCSELVEYDPVELEPSGVVRAASTVSPGGAPPEFAEYQSRYGEYATGIVAFDGPEGDSASLPVMFTGDGSLDLEIGDGVEGTIRLIYSDDGVHRYGLKVQPAD